MKFAHIINRSKRMSGEKFIDDAMSKQIRNDKSKLIELLKMTLGEYLVISTTDNVKKDIQSNKSDESNGAFIFTKSDVIKQCRDDVD